MGNLSLLFSSPPPQKWFTALERCTRTSCTISDLIMGNTYSFRVFAENACGLSEKAAVASGVAHIEKKSGDRDRAWGRWGGQEGSCPHWGFLSVGWVAMLPGMSPVG